MANITLKGNAIHTNGDLPAVGSQAPDFKLTDTGLQDRSLADFAGKKKLLTINPSLDTGICQIATKKFDDHAKQYGDTVVLAISSDLPFAVNRFCTTEGTENVVALSIMRSRNFAKDYGTLIQDGPMAGLTARAIVVLDEDNKVLYSELVPEITQEPDYQKALASLA